MGAISNPYEALCVYAGDVLLNMASTVVVAATFISSNMCRYISIPTTVFSITIFLGAWVIVRKNKII